MAARAADRVIAVSRATAASAARLLGVEKDRLAVIYEGVAESFASTTSSEAAQLVNSAFALEPGYLLTVGTIEPRKDHVSLLRALDLVPHVPQLVIAGQPGWNCSSILRAIQVQQALGRVRYLGRVDDRHLTALYKAARLLVYPSIYEGFGLPVLEAMACGCPVLCSWSSSLPEVGGAAARYFRPGDPGHLAAKLTWALADERVLRAMSVSGLRQASRFSFRLTAERILDLVRAGVARHRAGPAVSRAISDTNLRHQVLTARALAVFLENDCH
jgi:glycosyltransferase involved in cell wall biosynthesis